MIQYPQISFPKPGAMLAKICFLLVVAVSLKPHSAVAQEGGSNFRFGLKIAPQVAWLSPDDSKRLQSDGAKLKFNAGLITEFKINNSASFVTGIEMNSLGGSLNFTPSDSVYYNPVPYDSEIPANNIVAKHYVRNRTYRANYVDIPLTLRLRTPEIGVLTYFAQVGMNMGIRTKVKANDVGSLFVITRAQDTVLNVISNPNYTLEDIDISKDMNLFRLGLNLGAGFEYNLVGTTNLLVGINYHNSFTNALKERSNELFADRRTIDFRQIAKNNFVQLTIGVLF
jgi:hypothetical protein